MKIVENALEVLKEKLISAPILSNPKGNGELILDTDASGHTKGEVLSQVQNGEEKVIAYASRMLVSHFPVTHKKNIKKYKIEVPQDKVIIEPHEKEKLVDYNGDIHCWVSSATMGVLGPNIYMNDIENIIRMDMTETIRQSYMERSTQPLPSWSQLPWPQSYPYGGFMPNQPGFWPYRDNIYGPPSGVATAPPEAVSLTPAVAPSNPVPDSRAQSSSSSHGNQGSESAPFSEVTFGLWYRRRPEPTSKSAHQPSTKETEDPTSSLNNLRDKVYTLMGDEAHIPFASPSKPKRPSSTFEASCGISQDTVTSHNSFPESGHMAFALQIINEDLFPFVTNLFSSLLGTKPVDGLRLTQTVWTKTENLLRSASQVLGTAEHFLAAAGHLLNSEHSVVPAEVRSFLLQRDKALGSFQLLLMGSIANCTVSKRAELLGKTSVAESLKDSLLKSPLSDKMFGLPLQRVQEELSKNPPPVKVNVQVNNGKRSVNATSSSTSTSASGGPPSSAKKRKINYGKPQNKSHNSGKSSGKPSVGFNGPKKSRSSN
ncbi:unnamed protein product [Mytilus coruscus]|uniref:Reverse transcriptase/retrotransposon-derived protein RNase H-like domain-containing protein n=1 Tax=Mytilus coruscus TaxID=42192 RepID=A0A6J8CSP3_MYTCO|nr:unnamed protein product [Mytilus coruscus]